MIDKTLGPYTIDAELGSGGMGKVYRAKGPDGIVALKIVHPHLLETPGFFKRFLREAEVGKAVRHDNVVRTLDVDALGGHHFLVMEYVQGKSLRDLLSDLGTIPETLLREIALQTAAGLAAIHEAGIVHRDLKPENILITDDHEIRIMDLGVAKLQEATIAITREGQFAGSLLYAAPEQFNKDDEVGPRADLYSLGVLLYELATAQNPFRSDDAAAVIQAQIHETPPRAHERNDDLSLFFAEVVATLLAKKPGDRFDSAATLTTVLTEAEESAWWVERAPALQRQQARLPKIRVGRDTKLHGRADDLQALREAWRSAKAGDGNTVFVEGEAGVGKTRLVDEFVRGLEEADIHVLYGAYPPSGGLGGISNALLEKLGKAGLTETLAPYLTETPTLVPAFAAVLKHESPPSGADPVQGDALNAVCVQLMRSLAEEKPLIWIVENLDFAAKESRDTVLSLARATEGHRVLLIATARPGVPENEQAHFSRLDNYRRLALSRLGGRQIAELLEDAFKSEALADKLGMKIAKKSDGVPFFVFELIRGLKEGQFIKQLPDGSYVQTQIIEEIEIPSAVKDLIEGRLRGLSEQQRMILDVGAVQGMTFDPGLVAVVLEEKRVRVLQKLAEVERRFGVIRGESGTIQFDQNQIQEVIYRSLLPDLRAEYHTLLAEAYADRLDGEAAGDDACFLASHHLRGIRPKEGLPHLLPALEFLEKSYRNDDALVLCRDALATTGLLEGTSRVEILLQKTARLDLLGRRDEQRTAVDEAVALADEAGDDGWRSRAHHARGVLLQSLSQFDGAQAEWRAALELARAAGDRKLEARATNGLGHVLKFLGRLDEARAHYEQYRALAREIGDRRDEAGATVNLGNVHSDLGRYEEARAHYERGRELARESGQRRFEAIANGNLGLVFGNLGRYEEARTHDEQSRALSREIGYRSGEAGATLNLGIVFADLGRHEEARAHCEQARALSREIGDRRGEASATNSLGVVFADLGRLEEARAHCEQYRALALEIGDRRSESLALANLGPLEAQLGRLDAALDALEESLAITREIGDRRAEGYALHGLGQLARQRGDPEMAHRHFEEAAAVRRDLNYRSGLAATLAELGDLEHEAGHEDAARALLDESLAMAREVGSPNLIVTAALARARLPDGDRDAALSAYEEHRDDLPASAERSYRLWRLTRDAAHLAEAKRQLDFEVEHAPEDCRETMIENVPLHRDIMKAWEEHGEKG
jgi:tetratricopeptide (TPR) repeat protein